MQKVVQVRDPFWGLRAQAIISFVLVWVAILLVKTRSKQHKIEFAVLDTNVYRLYGFWFAALFGIFCMFGYVVVLYTIVNFTTSLGYSAHQGSIAAAMIQLGSCVGRPLVGLSSDRYGPTTMAAIAYTLSGVLCLAMWIPARNYATVVAFALLMGAIMGSIFGTIAPMVARLVGIKKMNIAFSNLWVLVAVGSLVAPVIGASLVEGSGGVVDPKQYVYCSLFAGVSFMLCALCLFLLRGYILGRDKVIAVSNPDSEQDLRALELDSDTLLRTRVPLAMTLSHAFNFRCGKA
jgi:MFS family permease